MSDLVPRLRAVRAWARSSPWIGVVAGVVLFAGLVLDLSTSRELVVAVVYAIPVALTGLSISRWLTGVVMVAAVGANVAAAVENARSSGAYDALTLTNRVFASSSIVLVGALALAVEHADRERGDLRGARDDAARERRLREVIRHLSAPMSDSERAAELAVQVGELLGADGVVVTAVEHGRFTDEPRHSDGLTASLAQPGSRAAWAVDAIPSGRGPAISVRSDGGLTTVGRWRRPGGDLVVVANRPDADKASTTLGDLLDALEPIALHHGCTGAVEGRDAASVGD